MRRRLVGPFKIVERRNQFFEVHKGRAVLSRHDNYLDAEDYALRAWLHNKSHDDEERARAADSF